MCVTALQALVSCQPGTFMMTCRAVARRIGREVERTEGSSERRRTMILLQRVRSSRGGRVKLRPQAMCRSTEPIANHTLCIPLIPLPSTSCTLVLRVLLFTSSSASSSTNISTVSPGTSAIVGDFWATLVGGLGTLVLRWCMQFATTMLEVTTTHASGTIRAMYISKVEKSANSAMVVVFELCDHKMSR
jgi:hypothetical protein